MTTMLRPRLAELARLARDLTDEELAVLLGMARQLRAARAWMRPEETAS